jgi:hypothetical protein
MCQRTTCRDCGKPSFTGCGRHVESVLGDVPATERCRCHAPEGRSTTGSGGPATALGKLLDFVGGGKRRQS